jgi:phosphopantothenoylcysteine decarboxylase/phosphopantothenate--cysteine ligase
MSNLAGKRAVLIISGGIAAYKGLELIRLLRSAGCGVNCIMTDSARHFVTPLSVQALSESKVYADLFSLTDESEMGHIQLSRSADLLVVAPASADLLARMAAGMANDLAAAVLLATDKQVLVAPAMNVRMWLHPATQANMALLQQRGVHVIGPDEGLMACNEFGPGRMAEPHSILAAIDSLLGRDEASTQRQDDKTQGIGVRPQANGERERNVRDTDMSGLQLAGLHALVTSGPTHEPIDPVRYIANRSSGRQGHAIAAALASLGARVTLVSGPVSIPDPAGVTVHHVETAREMLEMCQAALPADVAVFAAAVADWRVANTAASKIKKALNSEPPTFELVPNPDVLASIAAEGPTRPRLVVGFAAETDNLIANALTKRQRKNADWIVANDVSPASGIMGGKENAVSIITAEGVETWPRVEKETVAKRLADRIAITLSADLRRSLPL